MAANKVTAKSYKNKKSQSKIIKKWTWTPEMVDTLITTVKEYKSLCEFNLTDFDGDKIQLYNDVRKSMAQVYSDFGPVEATKPWKSIKEMNEEEVSVHNKGEQEEQNLIKQGYGQVKEKLKCIRQGFSKAVTTCLVSCKLSTNLSRVGEWLGSQRDPVSI